MSVGITHTLFLVGKTPEDAIKNGGVHLLEEDIQKGLGSGYNIYSINVTLFASRLSLIEKNDWEDFAVGDEVIIIADHLGSDPERVGTIGVIDEITDDGSNDYSVRFASDGVSLCWDLTEIRKVD